MKRWAWIATIVFGVVLVLGAIGTWVMVSTTLSNQKITVAEDADCLAGARVRGPLSAYCQARVIEKHTLDITDGLTYAELDRDDPRRQTAMNSSVLQASDRKSTRLNSSHVKISYAVFCLKKKNQEA